MLLSLFVVLVAVLLGIFFISDGDLPLILLPKPPAKSNQGKIVWIIGASSGIGASLAMDYAKDGATVILSSRRVEQLNDVANKCATIGVKPMVLPMDVTNFDEHLPAFQKVVDTFGHVDVLVLNAGISQRNLAVDTPYSVTEEIMKLNFFSLVALNKVVLPSMLSRKSGKVTFILLTIILTIAL